MKAYTKASIVIILLIMCLFTGCANSKSSGANEKMTIGVVVGKFDDTWRTSLRNELYKMAGDKVEVDIWNGNNSQKTEDQKVDALIDRKVNVLAINLIDTSSAASIIDKAKKADIPVIFFNTEPSAEDIKRWDKVYYVGSKGEQSGTMQGQILVNYFRKNPTKDGTIRYVMLEGQKEHPDTAARTKYSVKAIEDAGYKVQKIAEDNADWEREKAQGKMESFLDSQKGNIDCVISNNDDMAMGAVDALKNNGYFNSGKYMPVVGVDATSGALNAIKNGILLGTVLNDAVNQGKAIFNLSSVLGSGKIPDKSNFSYAITDNKYIWIDYKIITKENINDAK